MLAQLAAFLGIAVLVIVTPGPDTALTIRNTLLGGRRSGVLTATGVATGQAAWTVATGAGVAALLVASEPAFVALRLLGAAYLVYLGAQALVTALRPGEPAIMTAPAPHRRRLSPLSAYRQGVLSNLSNPKMVVFFTSLLPQFASADGTSVLGLLALGLVFCLLTLAWLAGYAAVVAKAGGVLGRPRIRRALDGLTGCVLVVLGLRLANESH